jgi:hypothetical protein
MILLSDTKLCNTGSVALDVLSHQIIKQFSALTDHLEKPAAGVIVLGVCLEMLGELRDALGENGNLHLGRTCIGLVCTVAFDYCSFLLFGDHSIYILS